MTRNGWLERSHLYAAKYRLRLALGFSLPYAQWPSDLGKQVAMSMTSKAAISDGRHGQVGAASGETVFISYRHDDDPSAATLISIQLLRLLPSIVVHVDTESLRPGSVISNRIRQQITSSCAVIVIIGKKWLSILQDRQHNAGDTDWVRLELQFAAEQEIPIVPVLVNGAKMPTLLELPRTLQFISELKAIEFNQENQSLALDRLISAIHERFRERKDLLAVRLADEIQQERVRATQLRGSVAAVCRTKHASLSMECVLNGVYFDILYRENDYGRIRTVGIICISDADRLTAEFLSTRILGLVQPQIDAGALNLVILVTNAEPSVEARRFAENAPFLRLHSLAGFQEETLSLRSYVEVLAERREIADFDSYYIDPVFENGDNALESVFQWLSAPGRQSPLAILGGYGVGKTSFSRKLVHLQARRHLENANERIPIRIALGASVHEFEIEGIFGKEFTSIYAMPNFHFRTLEQLNREGRLLIVFDGFDEMKHGMSAHDFRANFRQINRLNDGNSRVVVLGRPNAMPTEERNLVFRGEKRYLDTDIHHDPEWEKWDEKIIRLFDEQQVRTFLTRYFKTKSLAEASIEEMRRNIVSSVEHDLLSRPVQTKMIADLALQQKIDLKGLTRTTVYKYFIEGLVERDSDKPSRSAIVFQDRLEFQKRLAWWSWTRANVAQGVFARSEIPIALLDERPELPHGNATSTEALFNEYVVGTLTEEKQAGVLFFAHRSFQEYLAADYMTRLSPEGRDHERYARWLTPEMCGFLKGRSDKRFLPNWSRTLSETAEILPPNYLHIFRSPAVFLEIHHGNFQRGTYFNSLMILLMNWETVRSNADFHQSATILLGNAVTFGDDREALLAIHYLLCGDRNSIQHCVKAIFAHLVQPRLLGTRDLIAETISPHFQSIREKKDAPVSVVHLDLAAIDKLVLASPELKGALEFGTLAAPTQLQPTRFTVESIISDVSDATQRVKITNFVNSEVFGLS